VKVQDVMTWEVETCGSDSNLAQAAEVMWRRDCGIVPIVENPKGRLVGVVTDRDICIASATKHQDPALIPTRDAMTRDVLTCSPTDDVHVALKTMKNAQVHRLPVTDPSGALIGLLSLNDCILAAEKTERRGDAAVTYRDVMETLKTISTHREKVELVGAS
jgi:CBS domain-containing protein